MPHSNMYKIVPLLEVVESHPSYILLAIVLVVGPWLGVLPSIIILCLGNKSLREVAKEKTIE